MLGFTAVHLASARTCRSTSTFDFTDVHNKRKRSVLLTWELRDRARRKRWFYVNLKRILIELPPRSWGKIGGSMYPVDEEWSHDLRELLKRFEGSEFRWHEFRVEA